MKCLFPEAVGVWLRHGSHARPSPTKIEYPPAVVRIDSDPDEISRKQKICGHTSVLAILSKYIGKNRNYFSFQRTVFLLALKLPADFLLKPPDFFIPRHQSLELSCHGKGCPVFPGCY